MATLPPFVAALLDAKIVLSSEVKSTSSMSSAPPVPVLALFSDRVVLVRRSWQRDEPMAPPAIPAALSDMVVSIV